MGNYFNELRWKIIRANNLLQLIHQVTIEIRFRKSLAQERFNFALNDRKTFFGNGKQVRLKQKRSDAKTIYTVEKLIKHV